MRRHGLPVCFSKPFWDDFIAGKLEEFFHLVPEVDGVNLTFEETLRGYNICATRAAAAGRAGRRPWPTS